MNDRELLEAAARAIGLPPDGMEGGEGGPMSKGGLVWSGAGECIDWNPLVDDGDALRLAVKCRLNIGFGNERVHGNTWENVEAFAEPDSDGRSFCPSEEIKHDPMAAVRRVIVRAAAELSRSSATGEKG